MRFPPGTRFMPISEFRERLEEELRARKGGFFLHVYLSSEDQETLEAMKEAVESVLRQVFSGEKQPRNVEELESLVNMRGPRMPS